MGAAPASALREEEARSVAILHAMRDFIATANLDGNLLFLNSSGRELIGLGQRDDIADLRLPALCPGWQPQPPAGADPDQPDAWNGESSLRRRDGSGHARLDFAKRQRRCSRWRARLTDELDRDRRNYRPADHDGPFRPLRQPVCGDLSSRRGFFLRGGAGICRVDSGRALVSADAARDGRCENSKPKRNRSRG